jgi:hypothetical protein
VFTAVLGHLTSAVPARHAPDISGLFTTTSQIGGSVGVAGFGSLYLATAATGGGHAFALTAGAMAAVALLAVIPARLAARAAAPRNGAAAAPRSGRPAGHDAADRGVPVKLTA